MTKEKSKRWVEVVVAWGEQVLAVHHVSVEELEAGKCFWVGDGTEACDFVVAQDEVGASRFALVSSVLGVPHAHMPVRARAHADETSSTTWADGAAIPLSAEQRTTIEVGALRFHVRIATPEEAPRGAFVERIDRPAFASFLSTFGLAGALFGALAFAAPPLWASEDEMTRERLLLIQQYLDASALREEKLEKSNEAGEASVSQSSGNAQKPVNEPVEKHSGGAAGGPKRSDKPGPSRAEVLSAAQSFGMNALLSELPAGVFSEFGRTPSAPGQQEFGDPSMFTEGLGESSGFGSLGIGEGAGGPGAGIGISGPGAGLGEPGRGGFGPGQWGPGGPGLTSGGHKAKGPGKMRMATPEVGGHMPPEVIQRVVRQNFGRMRMCYEQGLGRNPNLEGRVEVRFLIGSDGRVGSASSGASSMPDSAVTSCVVSVFYAISFPAPESGTVRVTYPISFTPS